MSGRRVYVADSRTGNMFWLDNGVLMSAPILPDGTADLSDPVEVDMTNVDDPKHAEKIAETLAVAAAV